MTAPLTRAELDALTAQLAAARPRPWKYNRDNYMVMTSRGGVVVANAGPDDGELIVTLGNHADALIATARREAEARKALTVALAACETMIGLANESNGIDGYHRNGALLTWQDAGLPELLDAAEIIRAALANGGES